MTTMARGQRMKLADLTAAKQLQVALNFDAPNVSLDFSCFGLDENGKLSDDRYFIFYNQTQSPENSLQLTHSAPREARFAVDLARLPKTVTRLVFVATVDGAGTMSGIARGQFSLGDANGIRAQLTLQGSDFGAEKAIMVAEVYFKGEWRVAAVGQGFAEGLSAVLKHFGGEEIEETPPPAAVQKVASPVPTSPKPKAPKAEAPKATPKAPKVVSLKKADSSFKIDLNKASGEILATAIWVDNGDNRSDNDDLDLRAGILLPNGSMKIVTCSKPGSLTAAPYVLHTGDVKSASKQKPGTEKMKVNAQIAEKYGGDIAIVFSIYSAISNGPVSIASLKPRMKLQYGGQTVECDLDFSSDRAAKQKFVYTYVIGLAIIRNGGIEISPGGQVSEPASEATPWLHWDGNSGVKVTMDGPAVIKSGGKILESLLNTGNRKRYI